MKGVLFLARFYQGARDVLIEKKEKGKRAMTTCPECEADLNLQGLMIGEILYCPDCNAELEVLNVEQPKVALAPQVEEDWGE